MAKIETYTVADSPISGSDKLIGTDSAHDNATKNFTVNELADFIGGGGSYQVYTALVSQEASGDPSAIVLENTIGTIEWYRDSIGLYYAYSPDSLFDSDFVFVTITYNNGYKEGTVSYYVDSYQNIYVSTLDDTFAYADDCLYKTSVEIRIYPPTP